MNASAPSPPASASLTAPSIEAIDEAVKRFATEMNVLSYRMLVLVREFDERFGWAKWGFSSCAEWLLCTRHHRLVHEGAFRLRRGADGELEFRRPDGRLIPRCGYRPEDAAPDPAVLDDRDRPSRQAWLATLLRSSLSRRRRSSRFDP